MLKSRLKDDKGAFKKVITLPSQVPKKYEWLKGVESLVLANAQLNLNKAYKNFFLKRLPSFQSFNSKRHKQSCTTNVVNDNIQLLDVHIKLPKLKWSKSNNIERGITQALKFCESVSDKDWAHFFLQCKRKEQGKQLIKINKRFPYTKTCSLWFSKRSEIIRMHLAT